MLSLCVGLGHSVPECVTSARHGRRKALTPARGLPWEHALRAVQAPLSHRPPALRLRRAAPASCRLVLASRVIPLTLPPGTAPGGWRPQSPRPVPGEGGFP